MNSRTILLGHYRALARDYYVGQSLSSLAAGTFLVFSPRLDYWLHCLGLLMAVASLILLVNGLVPRLQRNARQMTTWLSGLLIQLPIFGAVMPVLWATENPATFSVLLLIEVWGFIYVSLSIVRIVRIINGYRKQGRSRISVRRADLVTSLDLLAIIPTISGFVSLLVGVCNPLHFWALALILVITRIVVHPRC